MQFRCNTVQYRVAPKRLLDIQNSRMRTVVAIHIALLARHAAPTAASIPFGSSLPTATRPAIRRPQAKQSDGHRPNNPTATGLANRRAQAMSPFNFLYCILMAQGAAACLIRIGDRVSFSAAETLWQLAPTKSRLTIPGAIASLVADRASPHMRLEAITSR